MSAVGELETLGKLGGHLGIRQALRTGFRDHDEIHCRLNLGLPDPESLPKEPLDPIPYHRVANSLANRHPEPRTRGRGGSTYQDEMRRVAPASVALHMKKLGALPEPARLRVPRVRHEAISRVVSEGWRR